MPRQPTSHPARVFKFTLSKSAGKNYFKNDKLILTGKSFPEKGIIVHLCAYFTLCGCHLAQVQTLATVLTGIGIGL